MLCQFNQKKITGILMVLLGVVSMAYGIIAYQSAPEDAHAYNQLLGMFTGFGTGLLAVGLFFWVRSKVVPKEKQKQQEIERNDERNIAIVRAALSVAALVAMGLFAVLAFVFTGMGYLVPSYFCLGAMYVLVAVYLISVKVLGKKM